MYYTVLCNCGMLQLWRICHSELTTVSPLHLHNLHVCCCRAAYLFMLDNFQWILNAETLQPLRFRFGGSMSYFDYTSPIVPLTTMPSAPFDVPANCSRKCPFKFA